jgi:hypothetical protein
VGIALSIFNTATKLCNMPLLSVTTSSVARAQGASRRGDGGAVSAAASSSILIAGALGVAQVSAPGCRGGLKRISCSVATWPAALAALLPPQLLLTSDLA